MTRRPADGAAPSLRALPSVTLARDEPRDALARATRSGAWRRVGRGVYVVGDDLSTGASVAVGHRLALARVVGLHRRLASDHWFSHESAALVWGLPTWRAPALTHVLQRYMPGLGADPQVIRHSAVGERDELTERDGLPVTTLERTAVDCAMTLPARDGLVIADAALRSGADRAELGRLLDARAGRRGISRARAVIELADDGAESPGESAARHVLLRDGFPPPETQVPVATRLGTRWADLGWPPWRLLLEYDGRQKYRGVDDLVREKRRHDALVETGHTVLRVTKEDLRGGALSARVLAALDPTARPPLKPRRVLRP